MRRSWGGAGEEGEAEEELGRSRGGVGEGLERNWEGVGGAGEGLGRDKLRRSVQLAWKRGLGQCFREAERLGLGGGYA